MGNITPSPDPANQLETTPNTTAATRSAFPLGTRKAIDLSAPAVRTSLLETDNPLPLVIEPLGANPDLPGWLAANRSAVNDQLMIHGAILFRGWNVKTMQEFHSAASALSGKLLEYTERTSPRTQVGNSIYTSTDYPSEHEIFPHNENSYAATFPLKLFFWCDTPSLTGGETPLIDVRHVLKRLHQEIVERFVNKGWMYIRNFGTGLSLSWQNVFQTKDPQTVEQYCRKGGIEFEWKPGNGLRTRQVRPVLAVHPKSGESLWFNHLTFFHITTLPREMQELLLSQYAVEDLPNNTYYGDGSTIEDSVMDQLRAAYRQEMILFPWEKGDVVIVDNMLTGHARCSYRGPRRILVAMAEPYTRSDLNLSK